MGTRSNTVVINNGNKILNLYRQFDGYPSGHGAELAEFLGSITMVNGLGPSPSAKQANGMGCLAAQIVAHFKSGPGGIYIDSPDRVCDNDYTYAIRGNTMDPEAGLMVTVDEYGKEVFSGPVTSFINFCKE